MKLILQKNTLMNAINIVMKAVPSKSTMTILEFILIEANDGRITLTGNDMRLAIKTVIEGEIIEEGRIAVNAKLFSDIGRSLPDSGDILFEEEDENIFIRCGSSNFNISGAKGNDFPVLPEIVRDSYVRLTQFTLKEIISQTIFSISMDETVNPQMSGELFEVRDNLLRVVALDGHRIALRRVELKDEYESLKVIVPGKTMMEISRIIPGDAEKDVYIYFDRNYILFEYEDTIVLSRLIEGDYYRVDQMISGDYETSVVVNRKAFLDAIERSTLLAKDSDKKPIVLNISGDNMELSMKSMIGSMKEDIPVHCQGKDIVIGFNPRFLIDVLRALSEEDITLYLVNPRAPIFIRNDDGSYLYLILPVNIGNVM